MSKRFALLLLAASFHVASAWAGAVLQSFTVTTAAAPPSSGVFASIGPQAGRSIGAGVTWPVSINLALLGSQPSSVTLNFPDRPYVTLSRVRSQPLSNGSFTWTGRGPGCSVVFNAWTTGFSGTISCTYGNYGIDSVPGASSLILTRYDQSGASSQIAWEPTPSAPPPMIPLAPQAPTSPGDPPDTAIDILVLYTEGVRQHFDPSGGKTSTVQHMLSYVTGTQHAMDNSTITNHPTIATVNMVAAKRVSRPDSGSLVADRTWVVTDSEPMGLRKFWKADVVVYVTENGGTDYFGLAWEPSSEGLDAPGPGYAPFAAATVLRSHAMNDESNANPQQPFVSPHEFAHTLGANHEVGNGSNPATPVESWAYGHWAPNAEGGNRTIMSYLVPGCTLPCVRILNYSNAGVQVDWFRTGVAGQKENARTIQDFASTTAQYFSNYSRIFADDFEF